MGNRFATPVPARPAVPAGKTRICVAGFGISHHTGRAQKIAAMIANKNSDKYETWFYFSTLGYRSFLKDDILPKIPDDQKSKPGTTDKGKTIGEHTSSPFVWLETSTGEGGTAANYTAIGGRDKFVAWVDETFPNDAELKELTKDEPGHKEVFFDNATPGGTYAKE